VFSRDDARAENPHLKEKEIKLLEERRMKDNIGNDICIDNTHMSSSLE